MKLFKANILKQIEQYYITSHGVSSLQLMDSAADQFVRWYQNSLLRSSTILIICGTGNNGADGLIIAIKLDSKGYKTKVLLADTISLGSLEYQHQIKAIRKNPHIEITQWNTNHPPSLGTNDILIDAIFGIGLNRPIIGKYAELITWVNKTGNQVYSVDIPSGLHADEHSSGAIVNATATLTFQFPKLCFLHKESEKHLGLWKCVGIGISVSKDFIDGANQTLITKDLVRSIIPKRNANSHKGTFGHACLISGSNTMGGASILSAKGALSTGVGLCTIVSPNHNYNSLLSSVPEALFISRKDFLVSEKQTYGIGPGLGTSNSSISLVRSLLNETDSPLLIDADALNIIAAQKSLFQSITPYSIITPHPKEFERLFGATSNTFERLHLQLEKSIKYKLIIVLKDHYTTITTPDGDIYYNATGNSGMATGGSGDVLSGVITGWLAQGLSPLNAAICGVYLAGLAADLALESENEYTLTPSKSIEYMANAINQVTKRKI